MSLLLSNARTLGNTVGRDVADRVQRLFSVVSPIVAKRLGVPAIFDVFPVSSFSFCSDAFSVPAVFDLLSMIPFAGLVGLPAFLDFFGGLRGTGLFWYAPVRRTVQRLSVHRLLEPVNSFSAEVRAMAGGLCFILAALTRHCFSSLCRNEDTDASKVSLVTKFVRRLLSLNQAFKPSKGSLAIEDVPEFMRHNVYIKTGYRNYRTRTECVRGILSWHNETVNIWSNLIAIVALASLTIDDYKTRYDAVSMPFLDRCISSAMSASYAAMLTLSTLYHVFNCRSESTFRFWYLWDFFGIWFSMLAYAAGFTVLQFRGRGIWQCAYLSAQAVIAVAMCCMTFAPVFRRQEWDGARTKAVGAFVVFSLVPLVHSVTVNPECVVKATVGGHWSVLAILVLSFLVFTAKFPEARFPGAVDLLGSSHQMWHLGILLSVIIAHDLYFSYIVAYNKLSVE